ncbi:hypothetical protein ABMA27_009267 [Loxostege sticticalis]|uniref:Uncharacterized protein n=1 Tax=Loxostege sticticalis TaxID=481309 RepID=A0ABR3HAG7_LOXSC
MDQFVRADSTNLPKVETVMIIEFLTNNDKHNIAEVRGAKTLMSSRDSYVDSAVGYVEVKRTSATCIVRAKIVPEHRVTNKQYLVTVTLDEHLDEIKDASCEGCVASAGGCKHTMLLMFWLDKKSKEPASTSVQCYWKKPSLAGVRADPVECEDVFPNAKKI